MNTAATVQIMLQSSLDNAFCNALTLFITTTKTLCDDAICAKGAHKIFIILLKLKLADKSKEQKTM